MRLLLHGLLLCLISSLCTGQAAAAVRVGNFVWEDLDKDGVQDSGEQGIPGVTVQIWNSAMTSLVGSAVTNATGNYQIMVPDNAHYRMRVILPYAGDRFTLPNVGSDTTDSDILSSSTNIGTSNVYTFASGVVANLSLDAGVISDPMRDHNIGDKVFRSNVDGLQTSTTFGRSGVTVELLNTAGVTLQSMVSGSSGHYSFKALPGTYRLRFTHPSEVPTPMQDNGTDDSLDSDIDENGYTDFFTVAAGSIRRDIDAGFVTKVNHGNFVWNDLNGNGIQDSGEPGIPGVVVQLWNSSRTRLWDHTTTNANGNYTLQSPGGGSFRLRAILPYAGDTFSPKDAGTNDQLDSDINPNGVNFGFTDVYTLGSNVISSVIYDVGIIADPMKDHTIGDKVFRGLASGLQGEGGVTGVTVRLLDSYGAEVQTTVSTTGGFYSFKAPPGTYRLHFHRDSYIPSPFKDVGSNDTIDSDIDENGYTDLFNLLPGQVRRDLDAGMVTPVNVGNLVWRDLDGDGIQDAGEPGLANVGLELWNAQKTRRYDETATNASGNYTLRAPGPGSYRVFVLRPLPADSFSPFQSAAATTQTDSNILSDAEHFGYTDVLDFAPNLISTTTVDAGIILATGSRVIVPFRVTGITPGSASTSLVFTGPAGGTYRIDRSADMRTWTQAVAPFVSSASTVTRTVPVPAGSQRQFFRVRRTR